MDASRPGVETVMRYADALSTVTEICQCHGRTETIETADAHRRVVATEIRAERDVPAVDRAQATGVAVRATDTAAASSGSPVRLTRATDSVGRGTAMTVCQGHRLPPGADAVVPGIRSNEESDGFQLFKRVAAGANVAAAGIDAEEGDLLVEPGESLGTPMVGLLVAADRARVTVYEPPTVAISNQLPGHESRASSAASRPGATVQMLENLGVERVSRLKAAEAREQLSATVEAVSDGDTEVDLLVVSGSSAGTDNTPVATAIDRVGELACHGVAMEPGGGVVLGSVDGLSVVGIPAEPASSYVAGVQFLRPALDALGGRRSRPGCAARVSARLETKVSSQPGVRTFVPVTLSVDAAEKNDRPSATPTATRTTGSLAAAARANGWLEVAEADEGLPAGDTVHVQQWGPDRKLGRVTRR